MTPFGHLRTMSAPQQQEFLGMMVTRARLCTGSWLSNAEQALTILEDTSSGAVATKVDDMEQLIRQTEITAFVAATATAIARGSKATPAAVFDKAVTTAVVFALDRTTLECVVRLDQLPQAV